jgi:hypothetical protein
MLNLLYINALVKPLPLVLYIWNYLMVEEIIAIEHPIPILVSKVVFFILYLLLSWALLFMHILIESKKNVDFNFHFKRYRECLTVHILNYSVVTIFWSIIVLFIAHSWIGDGYYYEPELFEPFGIYGNIKEPKCIVCAILFFLAKISIYIYFFIYWLFFKTFTHGRINCIVFYKTLQWLYHTSFKLIQEDKGVFEFVEFKDSYNTQLLLRLYGLIWGILILYIVAFLFCNIIVYKFLAVKIVYV